MRTALSISFASRSGETTTPLVMFLGVALVACGGSIESNHRDAAPEADAAIDAPALVPLRDDTLPETIDWRDKVASMIDSTGVAAAFSEAAYIPPTGALAYALRVTPNTSPPEYAIFEYSEGAFRSDFWPASTIKLFAALGALDLAAELGFTGAAEVIYDGLGSVGTLRSLYSAAIKVSDNLAYTRLLQIAGVERINTHFLTEERDFITTALHSSYVTGLSARTAPGMTFREDDRDTYVPARATSADYGCGGRNCTSLYELVEAMRRVLTPDAFSDPEVLVLDVADRSALTIALCQSESFFAAGAEEALGTVEICNKPGWVPDNYYLDHGLITDGLGHSYWLAAAVPWPAACSSHGSCVAALSALAREILRHLQSEEDVFPLRIDSAPPISIQATRSSEQQIAIEVELAGAHRVEIALEGDVQLAEEGPSSRFVARFDLPTVDPARVVVWGRDEFLHTLAYRFAHIAIP